MAKTNRRTADQFAAAITKAWSASVGSIVRMGQLLIEAQDELPYGDWCWLFEGRKVPFGIRTAQRLQSIAGHPVLKDPTTWSYLPNSWRALSVLARLSEVDVRNNLGRDVHPEMTVLDAEKLVYRQKSLYRLDQAMRLVIDIKEEWPIELDEEWGDADKDAAVIAERLLLLDRKRKDDHRPWVFDFDDTTLDWLKRVRDAMLAAYEADRETSELNKYYDEVERGTETTFVVYDEPLSTTGNVGSKARPSAATQKARVIESEWDGKSNPADFLEPRKGQTASR
jgi:hypothetical protein